MTRLHDFLLTLQRRLYLLVHRERISLMEEDEFVSMLKRLGRWEAVESGLLKCGRCGRQLSADNVAAIVAAHGEFQLICDSTECAGEGKQHD